MKTSVHPRATGRLYGGDALGRSEEGTTEEGGNAAQPCARRRRGAGAKEEGGGRSGGGGGRRTPGTQEPLARPECAPAPAVGGAGTPDPAFARHAPAHRRDLEAQDPGQGARPRPRRSTRPTASVHRRGPSSRRARSARRCRRRGRPEPRPATSAARQAAQGRPTPRLRWTARDSLPTGLLAASASLLLAIDRGRGEETRNDGTKL